MNTPQSDNFLAELAALRAENAELRTRLSNTEEVLKAIQTGSIDAVVVGEGEDAQVYTLQGADHPYRLFVETMQEGAITLAEDHTILYANQSFARIVGTPLEKVIGTPVHRFVVSGEDTRFQGFLTQPNGAKCELHLKSDDGTYVPVYLSRTKADIDGVDATCLVVTDLTQQKRHEEIVAAERLARSILDQAAEAIVVCDERGHITHANAQAERLCGGNPLWRSFEDAFPLQPGADAADGEHLPERIAHPHKTIGGVEATLNGATRSRCYLLVSSAPLHDDVGRHLGAVVVLTDITGRKKAEAERERILEELATERAELQKLTVTLEERVRERTRQVEALSRSLTLAEQRERRRLSQVLHDDLQQMLFSAELRLNLLQRGLRGMSNDEVDDLLRECEHIGDVIHRAVTTSRTLSIELNPPVLRGEGVDVLLKWLGNHMDEHYGLDVDIQVDDDVRLEREDQEQLLIQLIRELLFNIVKHANVDRCRVSARETGDGLAVIVEDEGEGFDIEEVRKRHQDGQSLGLLSVEERLRLFGGEVDIDSEPGRGSTISLYIPRRTHRVRPNAERDGLARSTLQQEQ